MIETDLQANIHSVVRILREEVRKYREPAVTVVARKRDPFRVLISCLLSLRTKDDVTAAASSRLFSIADTAAGIGRLPVDVIEKAIFPAGFYRTKAATLRRVSLEILDRYAGRVPDQIDELLTLKGVGRKTANLVVTLAYGKPGICVDTHVHRISNRLGWVKTRTPESTETALRDVLPPDYWIEINDLLVTYGQNVCTPLSPRCSACTIHEICPKVGVGRHR